MLTNQMLLDDIKFACPPSFRAIKCYWNFSRLAGRIKAKAAGPRANEVNTPSFDRLSGSVG